MAIQIQLANEDRSTILDLYDDVLRVQAAKWGTRSAPAAGDYAHSPYGPQARFHHYPPVVELLSVAADDTDTNIRAAVDSLMDLLGKTRRYHEDPMRQLTVAAKGPESWWLEWAVDGETLKRALLYEGSLSVLTGPGLSPVLESEKLDARLALTRHPLYEPTSTSQITESGLVCWVGTDTFSSIPGNEPARMATTFLTAAATGGSIIYKMWAGIREEGLGMSNFEPLWELEDGNVAGGASVQTVAGASGGDTVQKASPASTLTRYAYMSVSDVCTANSHTDHEHQIGRYMVLLRCKVNAGTVGIQMRSGYSSVVDMSPSEEIFVDDTSFQIVELGEIQIPPMTIDGMIGDATSYAAEFMIELYAEQVSGTSTLDLDALALVPTSHFAFIDKAQAINYLSDFGGVVLYTQPDDEAGGYGWRGGSSQLGVNVTLHDWYLPVGNSKMVFVGTGETSSDMADTINTQIDYYPRYLLYR